MKTRWCRTPACLRQQVVLDLVKKYVDERAHLVRGEIRYTAVQLMGEDESMVKKHRNVLKNTDITRIFGELNG